MQADVELMGLRAEEAELTQQLENPEKQGDEVRLGGRGVAHES